MGVGDTFQGDEDGLKQKPSVDHTTPIAPPEVSRAFRRIPILRSMALAAHGKGLPSLTFRTGEACQESLRDSRNVKDRCEKGFSH